jgi:hypothetical protein
MTAAFDTVDHDILLCRLKDNFGISGSALQLISSYLIGRTQSVSLNSVSSAPHSVSSGVPQGSVLGPLLLVFTPLL